MSYFLNRLSFSVIVLACLLVRQSLAAETANIISRTQGNILRNLTISHAYKGNVVTSALDTSEPLRWFYRGFRDFYSRSLSAFV